MSNDVVRKLADSIGAIDDKIEELQEDKKQYYQSAKEQGINTTELRRAIKIKRMESDRRKKALDQRDLFDEYFEAIDGKR